MAYELELTNAWTEITLSATSTTTIQNKGNKSILLMIDTGTPAELDSGIEIIPKGVWMFIHDDVPRKLYLRANYLVDGETQRVAVI